MTTAGMIDLTIDEKVQNYAKVYSSLLSDEFQRKRAYASLTALYALIKILEKTKHDLDTSMTIFRNPDLNEQYEISDLYINNWHVDVRIMTYGNAFLVPKCHFDNNIAPDFYAVVKLDTKLEKAELVGFANTKHMTKEAFDYHYYSVSNSELINYVEFLQAVSEKKQTNLTDEDHTLFQESFLGLVDNEIDKNLKNRLLKHMFNCPECRTEFCCFTGFEMVNKNLISYPELIEDQTLNIIGAQAVDSPEYEGKEETINIEPEEQETQDEIQELKEELEAQSEQEVKPIEETQEETVSDILDELFSDEDTTSVEEKPVNTEIEEKELDFIDESDMNAAEEESQDDDLVFIEAVENGETEEQSIVEEIPESDMVQKVIVDYDEFGEPIYSYISDTDTTDNSSSDLTEIETIEDVELPTLIEETDLESTLVEQPIEEFTTEIEEYEEQEQSQTSNVRPVSYYFPEENDQLPVESTQEEAEEYADDSEEYADDTEKYEEYQEDNSLDEETSDFQTYDDTQEYPEESESSYDNYEESVDVKEDEQYEEYNSYEEENDSTEETEDYSNYEGDENDYDEEDFAPQSNGLSKQKMLIASAAVLLLLSCAGAFFFMKNINAANNDTIANNPAATTETYENNDANDLFEDPLDEGIPIEAPVIPEVNDSSEQQTPAPAPISAPAAKTEAIPSSGTIEVPKLTEKTLLNEKASEPTGDVNKVLSNAFSGQTSAVSVRGVNWQCAPALFTNKTFKDYLQGLDTTLKLNLRKNVLSATTAPQSDNVTVKMAIDNNGTLLKSLVASSSGSDEIDNIVLQSLKETLEAQKTLILSEGEQKADKYYIQVVIKL